MPDETTAACAVPTARAIAASNSSTFGPIVSWPVRTTSAIASSSASPDVRPREPDRLGHRDRVLAVPRDRALEPLVELDLRLEAEELARLVDVRDPQLDVRVVQRLELELSVEAR